MTDPGKGVLRKHRNRVFGVRVSIKEKKARLSLLVLMSICGNFLRSIANFGRYNGTRKGFFRSSRDSIPRWSHEP